MGLQVASRLQIRRGVRRLLTTAVLGLLGGCFYAGDLNDRPSAEIVRLTPGVPLRGATVLLQAVVVDPGDAVTSSWQVDACGGSGVAERCDVRIPVHELSIDTIEVAIPMRVGGPDGVPTERLVVRLDVVDSHGAVARPIQQQVVEVGNQAPTLAVQRRGRELAGEFPEHAPIIVAARAEDPEDDPLTLDCEVFAPRGSVPGAWTWDRLADPPTGGHEWRLVPDVPGAWEVHCTARDPLVATSDGLTITVVADRPPCVRSTDPAAVAGAVLVLDRPRRFAVVVVEDDLDVYPAAPGDPFLGVTSFRWSLRPVGAADFVTIDDVAAIELDPAAWAPGERFDVRVEVDDRRARGVGCPVDQPTCSLTLDSCLQRQTWRVEAR